MKTKMWILLIALLLIVSVAMSIWLLWPASDAAYAEVWSEGKLLFTLDLRVDAQHTVQTEDGWNVISVRDGKVAVVDANCPDHYCMDRGYCSGGAQIVCLPNRLVIKFVEKTEIDAVVG